MLAPVPADANFTELTRKEVQSPTQAKKTTTKKHINYKVRLFLFKGYDL